MHSKRIKKGNKRMRAQREFGFASIECARVAYVLRATFSSLVGFLHCHLSSLLAARELPPEGTFAPLRFHTDDVNQCLHKSGSHGVPNVNLFNFLFLLVDYGLNFVFCLTVLK